MDSLDFLMEGLRSTDPATRFSLLTRVETISWAPGQIANLRNILAGEKDPSLQFYGRLILAGLVAIGDDEDFPRETVEGLGKSLSVENPDYLGFLLRLKRLPRDELPLVVDLLRKRNWQEAPQEVIPFLVRIIRDHGGAADVPRLKELCRHPDPHVLAMAVEALSRISPEDLKPMLVALLGNSSPGIRSRAIRLLARWDLPEAIRHFEAILFSEDSNEVEAALTQAYFFPFESIQNPLLRFLSLERDPGRVRRAGRLFIINPSPETPQALVEIFEASTGETQDEIRQILLDVIRFLEKAGIIGQSASDFLAELKLKHREGKIRDALRRCRAGLASPDAEARRLAVGRLLELRSRGVEEAATILERHSLIEPDPAIRGDIDAWNRLPAADDQTGSFAGLVHRLAALTADGYKPLQEKLHELMTRVSPAQKAVLLHWICVFEGSQATPLLERCLVDPDPDVLCSALEEVGRMGEAGLLSRVEALVHHPEMQVQSAAVRASGRFDKAVALERCRQWLYSNTPSRRREGLRIAAGLDFPAIRSALLESFSREEDPEILSHYFPLFQQRLDEDIFLQIYIIVMNMPAGSRSLAEPLLRDLTSSGPWEKTSPAERETLWEKTRSAAEKEQSRRSGPQNPWTLEEIRKQRPAAPEIDRAAHQPVQAAKATAPTLPPPGIDESDPLADFLAWSAVNPARAGKEILSGVRARRADTRQPGLAFQLDVLLVRIQQPRATATLADLEGCLAMVPLPAVRLAVLLEILPRRDGASALGILRRFDWKRFPDPFLPFLLQAVKRFGGAEDTRFLAECCRHRNPCVVFTALEALERANPEELRPLLPHLLIHPHPVIRSRTIRSLYTLDPVEAVAHFGGALFSDDKREREAALDHAFFLPFPSIESEILRFLAWENEPGLLRKAGNLVRINPSPELPARLCEIAERAAGERLELIRFLIQEVVEGLAKADLLDRDSTAFLAELQLGVRTRRIRNLLEQALSGLVDPDPERRGLAVSHLATLARNDCPEAASHLRLHLEREKDPGIRKAIEETLQSASASDKPPAATGIAITAGVPDSKPSSESFNFPKLLQHENLEVREAAVRALAGLAPREALLELEQMINHVKPAVRGAGLFAIGWFDISLVGDLLLAFLEKETEESNRRQAIGLLLGRFDIGLYRRIFALRKEAGEPAQAARAHLDHLLEEGGRKLAGPGTGFADEAALREKVRADWEREHRSRPSKPPYAYSRLQKTRREASVSVSGGESPVERLLSWLRAQPRLTATACGALLLILGLAYGIMAPGEPPAPPVTALPAAARIAARELPWAPGMVREVKGIVWDILADGVDVRVSPGSLTLRILFSDSGPNFSHGDVFRGQVRFRREEKGRWKADLLKTY